MPFKNKFIFSRNLPCGIPNLNPAFNVPKNPDDDPLHAVNQRFAYLDPNSQKKKVQVCILIQKKKNAFRIDQDTKAVCFVLFRFQINIRITR